MSSRLKVKELTLFAILGAITFVAKMVVAHIPNVEPVSLMVMLLAVCYGWKGLYAVGIYVFLEFAVWGINMWSIGYLYVWPLLFALARLLRRMESPIGWALLSGFFGISFGALCAGVYWITGGWASALSWWVSGIPWDLVHGAANFVIALLLFKPLRKLLTQLNKSFGI